MDTLSPQARKSARTRLRLLAAAERELLEAGLRGVRVDAVARRAGVNKRMIYVHFGNREGLLAAVFAHEVDVICAADGITGATRRYLRRLFGDSDTTLAGRIQLATPLHQALRIVIAHLAQMPAEVAAVADPGDARQVALDLLVPVLSRVDVSASDKPRLRMTSASRSATPPALP